MGNSPTLKNLLSQWLWNRKYKIDTWMGLMIELSHYQMRGVLLGLVTEKRAALLYSPRSMDEGGASKYKKGEVFSYDVYQADFFPQLDIWLKSMRKRYPKRIS